MRTLKQSLAGLALAVGLAACSGGGSSDDAGGSAPDASTHDSGTPGDAGALTDAGSADAGAMDAGSADAGTVDAGPGADAGVNVHLSIALHRGTGTTPTAVLVTVLAADDLGHAVSGLTLDIDTPGNSVHASESAGAYHAIVGALFNSGELPITAHLDGSDAGVTRTALVLPTVADYWDQPEMLGGLVNTPGTEDSSTVSIDGQWLILGTYSPVDLLCCSGVCGGVEPLDGNSSYCDRPLGPVTAPARPNMPGAERVLATTINDAVPQMCAASPDGGPVYVPQADGGVHPFALPPVANYLFHRQSDGTFAEPQLINTNSDGFLSQPFCYTFLETGAPGATVHFIAGYNVDAPDGGKPHPWFGQLTLGAGSSLYSYACPPGASVPTFTPQALAQLPIGADPARQQAGNTTVAQVNGETYLLSDDESATPPYVEWSKELADGGFTDWKPMALPEPTADRRQPYFAGDRLYYYRNADIVSVSWNGNAPDDANAFAQENIELSAGVGTGAVPEVVAVGQPQFAITADGGAEMYFVYYHRTATGMDGQIGRVQLR